MDYRYKVRGRGSPQFMNFADPLLSQKPLLVRYVREQETTTPEHKIFLHITRSGGPKLLKASPSNRCTILSPADREYFNQVVTKLSNALYLVSPQSLEPKVGNLNGHLLIRPRRSIGPGATAARESVYAVLVDQISEGAYVCWICEETRVDRGLVRALDHVRGHFNHRPYHCSETHFDQHTEPASSYPWRLFGELFRLGLLSTEPHLELRVI